MQKTTTPRPRRQGSAYKHQTLYCRPGFGVRVMTTDPALRLAARPHHLEGTKRGPVKGFSKESAARLRRLLFELDYPAGTTFGIALTSAPWARTRPEDAFLALGKVIRRCPGLLGAVWRKEVTRKGLVHYHLVVWVASPADAWPAWHWLTSTWVDCAIAGGVCPAVALLSDSKAFRGFGPASPSDWASVGRCALQGVNCSFSLLPGRPRGNLVALERASALNYLCDHTSKHKDYQARTTGRAWGVWNRARLPVVGDVQAIDLAAAPPRLRRRVQVALEKASRYWWADPSAPFGYRWSRPRRFEHGDQVLFRSGSAEMVSRILAGWTPPRSAPALPTTAFRSARLDFERRRLVRCLADRSWTAPLV